MVLTPPPPLTLPFVETNPTCQRYYSRVCHHVHLPLVLSHALQPGLCDGAEALQEVVPALLDQSVFLAGVAFVLQLLPLHFEAHGRLALQKKALCSAHTAVVLVFGGGEDVIVFVARADIVTHS